MVYETRRLVAQYSQANPQSLLHLVVEAHHFDPKKDKNVVEAVEDGILAEINTALGGPTVEELPVVKKPSTQIPAIASEVSSHATPQVDDDPIRNLSKFTGLSAMNSPQARVDRELTENERIHDEAADTIYGRK